MANEPSVQSISAVAFFLAYQGRGTAAWKVILIDCLRTYSQHCNKHRKPYRCNLDGCPNPVKKRRFARRDGLERHQRMVAHAVAQHTVMA